MPTPASLHDLLDRVGPVRPGHPALLVAPSDVGTTALMCHLALQHLLEDGTVLHVAVHEPVATTRTHYDEVLRAARGLDAGQHATTALALERRRQHLSYVDAPFAPDALSATAEQLATLTQLVPDLVVVDGLDRDLWLTHGEALAAWSRRTGRPLWAAVHTEDAWTEDGPELSFVLQLRPVDAQVELVHVSPHGSTVLPWRLDPATLTVGAPGEPAPSLDPRRCTLYSGGAAGTEEVFGEVAASWGVREVHFTFDGHKQARAEGATLLSPRELEAGDVSLVYVSRRLHRTYNQHGLIRRVLQSLWHMVSRAQQIFVIGVIQDDGTVVGGTGWSVELARMWSKDLWVYDQDRRGWFRWDGAEWVADTPRITSAQICGTGTRYLQDHGRQAIVDLFARSFPDRQPAG